ncbi:MAG: HprK-related kinase B [Pseudomonadota bacterium]
MNQHVPTVAALSSAIVQDHPAQNRIFLTLGRGIRVQVLSNSPELLIRLRRYFHEFATGGETADILIHAIEIPPPDFPFSYIVKEPDPGKTKIKEEYIDLIDGRIVRKRLTGMVFMFGHNIHIAAGPCLANDNQIVNFINNRFMEWMLIEDGLLAHAAGICWNGHGMAIAGFSGTGKSTLSLRLLEEGAIFISNDRLILRNELFGLKMYGIPKHPRVNPGTLLASRRLERIIGDDDRPAFKQLSENELWHLEKKYDVHVHEVFGAGRFRLEAALKGVVVLTWKRNREATTIRAVDFAVRGELLEAFMKPVGLFFNTDSGEIPDFSPENYITTMKNCPAFEITGGVDFEHAADFIRNYLLEER